MRGTLKQLWADHPGLLLAFLLASTLALFFATRLIVSAVYWANHGQEAVQSWMTVGYIGRSWGLDPHEINAVAGLHVRDGHPLTLEDIARQRGVPVSDVVAQVEAAIAALRQGAAP